ncbi:MAG: ATP-dependent sacrificial sulfur transferase LarE [Candidatus Odinarchaeia archaeon]
MVDPAFLEEKLRVLPSDIAVKVSRIIKKLKGSRGAVVAFSGGVDGSLVLAFSKLALGSNLLAVTLDSVIFPRDELRWAKKIAGFFDVPHLILKVDKLSNRNIYLNPPDRCYHCKKETMMLLWDIAKSRGMDTVVDGTNFDDLRQYRPGLRALMEYNVYSPLAEVKLTKREVRFIAKALGLPGAERASATCFLSRFPYNVKVTADMIRRVSDAEEFIKKTVKGLKRVRVRDFGKLAKIEVEKDDLRLFFDEELMDKIVKVFKELGYVHVTLDMEGYRFGSMDEEIG